MANIDLIVNLIGAATAQQGVDDLAGSVEGVGEAAGDAQADADALKSKFEGLRETGGKLAAIGAGGIVLSHALAAAAAEGEAVDVRLQSILKAQSRLNDLAQINAAIEDTTVKGHFSDDDEIKDAAIHLASFGAETEAIGELLPRVARQVRTGFGTMTSVADGMGKALANFDLGPLAESGLLFTEQEKAAAAAAKEIGGAAGQMKMVEILMNAIDRNTVSLEDSLSEAESAANDASREIGKAMESIGTGAKNAESTVMSLGGRLAHLVSLSPKAAEIGGAAMTYVSYFVAATGAVISFVAQIGLANLAIPGLAARTQAAMAAMRLAILGTAGSVTALTVALRGLSMLIIPALLIPLGTMVIDAVADHFDKDGKSAADSRADQIDLMKGVFTKDFSGINVRAGRNQYAAETARLEREAAERVFKGTMSKEESDKKLLADRMAMEKRFANEFTRFGAREDAARHMAKFNELSGSSAAAKATAASDASMGSEIFDTGVGPDTNSVDEEIITLKEQIKKAKTLGIKKALEAQLATLNRRREQMINSDMSERNISNQMRALQRQIQKTEGEEAKKALQEQLRLMGQSLETLKAQNELAKRAIDADESKAKRQAAALQEQLKKDQEVASTKLDVEENRLSNEAALKVAALEIQRDEAQEKKDKAREAQLTFEIALINAQQRRSAALLQASKTAMEDEDKAAAMRTIAEQDYQREIKIAQMQLNRKRSTITQGISDLLKKLTTFKPAATTTVFNPNADRKFPGTTGDFARQYNPAADQVPGLYGAGRRRNDGIVVRIKNSMREQGNGAQRIIFIADDVLVPNVLRDDVETIPGT